MYLVKMLFNICIPLVKISARMMCRGGYDYLQYRNGLLEDLEFITYSPNRFEDPLVRNSLQLFAETFYVYIDRSGVPEVIKAPNLIEKLIAGKYSVIVLGEEIEELELLRGNVD